MKGHNDPQRLGGGYPPSPSLFEDPCLCRPSVPQSNDDDDDDPRLARRVVTGPTPRVQLIRTPNDDDVHLIGRVIQDKYFVQSPRGTPETTRNRGVR